MNTLFLDDDSNRIKQARICFAVDILDIAETAIQAVKLLAKHSPYDLVSLDHDLGGKVYCPSDIMSGWAVAVYIAHMPKEKLPKQVVIHSFNPDGAEKMLNVLQGIVPVIKQPWTFEHVKTEEDYIFEVNDAFIETQLPITRKLLKRIIGKKMSMRTLKKYVYVNTMEWAYGQIN